MHEFEELYSDCVYGRAMAIMGHYDPEKGGSPEGHLMRCCTWYAYKWIRGTAYKAIPTPMDLHKAPELAGSFEGQHELEAQVSSLLDELDQEERNLVEWILMSGFTYEEISAHLGVSTKRVRKAYKQALECLKDIATENRNQMTLTKSTSSDAAL
jgi:RNA polymerase sigma factor (sigma-70 family)